MNKHLYNFVNGIYYSTSLDTYYWLYDVKRRDTFFLVSKTIRFQNKGFEIYDNSFFIYPGDTPKDINYKSYIGEATTLDAAIKICEKNYENIIFL